MAEIWKRVFLLLSSRCVCYASQSTNIIDLGTVTEDGKTHRYLTTNANYTWADAGRRCVELIPGGHLALLDDFNQTTDLGLDYHSSSFWIGGCRNSSWFWADGMAVNTSFLVPGSGDCLTIMNNTLKPIQCDARLRFFACSYAGSCSGKEGKILLNSTQRCIVMLNSGDSSFTWEKAKDKCLSFNMTFASLAEDDFAELNLNASMRVFVGAMRTCPTPWAKNNVTGIRRMKRLSHVQTVQCDCCLTISWEGILPNDCGQQHPVLCEVIGHQMKPSSKNWNIILAAVFAALFLLLVLVVVILAMRLRKKTMAKTGQRQHQRGNGNLSSASRRGSKDASAQNFAAFRTATAQAGSSQGLEATGSPSTAASSTSNHYAVSRIESIIERERREGARYGDNEGRTSNGARANIKERLSRILRGRRSTTNGQRFSGRGDRQVPDLIRTDTDRNLHCL